MALHNSNNKKGDDDGGDEWLSTYADCITLLLCFFVILLSVSEPKINKFEAIAEGMSSGFITDMIELPFKALYEDFQVIIEDQEVELDVAAEFTTEGVRLDIGSNALFNSGSATLLKKATPMIREMTLAIREMELSDYRIEVEGHTDNIPMQGNKFASNWELSAARAATVTRALIAEGMEKERMQMAAFADVKPKVKNLDPYGDAIPENQALNRRIVVHIIRGE